MRIAWTLSINNIRRKLFRSFALILLVLCLSFAVFAGGMTIMSLQKGLNSYTARLGADVIVVPNNATSHGAVDDIFLQGITGNYYMSGRDIQKIYGIEGIEAISKQFYLTSAKASCCSSRVQIIGIDPETDFSIQPWIQDTYQGKMGMGDIIVGANINVPLSRTLRFYGNDYHVVAQLSRTGTGLDSAVYTNMATIKEMAANSVTLLDTDAFNSVNIDTAASAVLIKVKKNTDAETVADDINIHITKVEASSSRSMIASLMSGLSGVSRVIGILTGIIWILALVILMTVFMMISNERQKEFAILRISGASRKILFEIMSMEALLISSIGAVLGILIGLVIVVPSASILSGMLQLPLLMPGLMAMIMMIIGSFALALLATLIPALWSAHKMTKSETGLLLREDA